MCYSLSPLLFNLYINNLFLKLESTGKCVDVNGDRVAILLYAEDILHIAWSENDLQDMLYLLYTLCFENVMSANPLKSNNIHFPNSSIQQSEFVFKIVDTM